MIKNITVAEEPSDRLTALANNALAAIPDEENVRVIVIVTANDENRSGIALGGPGYELGNLQTAVGDLLRNLEAVLNASGRELAVRIVPAAMRGRG